MQWIDSLNTTLAGIQKQPFKIAIIGIGQEMRGDDGVGAMVARALLANNSEQLLVIDAGCAPENFIGPICRFQPDLVLLIDAVSMDETPGTIKWFPSGIFEGFNGSTHSLSLDVFTSYLLANLNCEIALIGIQPAYTQIRDCLSPKIQQSAQAVVCKLAENLPVEYPRKKMRVKEGFQVK